jgi:hypothetical protein
MPRLKPAKRYGNRSENGNSLGNLPNSSRTTISASLSKLLQPIEGLQSSSSAKPTRHSQSRCLRLALVQLRPASRKQRVM